ncbi:MAG: amino acid racemase [Deltaproteobacteria bacterium]|jgi:aspartate racemase|nr:amino acid racemase [Deltaproteobacteria bacterium]
MNDKVCGILGGMGPEATVDFMRRVINLTPVKEERDHIHFIADINPKLPSRIAFLIEHKGEDPGPAIVQMAKNLESWGADFIAMPCNTIHHYLPDIQKAIAIPVLDMIELTAQKTLEQFSGIKAVGILASPAVRLTGIYARRFEQKGVRVIFPLPEAEESVLRIIKAIKDGQAPALFNQELSAVAGSLVQQGAGACVIACTELSLCTLDQDLSAIDAAEVLARAAVNNSY